MSNDKPTNSTSVPAEILAALTQMRTQQELLRKQLAHEQDQLQTLARRLWLQQEQERAKLSRELHDGLGQILTGLKTQLGQACHQQPELTALYQTASDAVDSIRNLSRIMHPTVLSDLGLNAAISWLNRQLLEPANIDFHSEISLPEPLDSDLQIFLFRIIQEAMVNTVKHAKAQQFTLYLLHASDCIRLDMIDDGKGFNLNQITTGIGLQSMHDRCKAFGAQMTVDSSLGNGCQISISLPYHHQTMQNVEGPL